MRLKLIFKVLCFLLLISFSHNVMGQKDDMVAIGNREAIFSYKPPMIELKDEALRNSNRWLRYTMLTGYLNGIKSGDGFINFNSYSDKKTGTRRIYMYNLSIQDMLTHGFYKSNRVILEVKNPNKYRYDLSSNKEELQWLKENGHCFELLMPYGLQNTERILNTELTHALGVKTAIEKRLVNVLVLTHISTKHMKQKKSSNNISLTKLIDLLSNDEKMPPIINETGYTHDVYLDLEKNSWNDLASLRKRLRRYGLNLQEGKHKLEMFVIYD